MNKQAEAFREWVMTDTKLALEAYENLSQEVSNWQDVESQISFFRAAAMMFTDFHQYEEAKNLLRKAQIIAESENNFIWQIEVHLSLGVNYAAEGDIAKAEAQFKYIIQVLEGKDMPKFIALAQNRLAILYSKLGQLEQALQYYLASLLYYDEIKDPIWRFSTRTNLLNLYSQLKMVQEMEDVYAYMNQYIHECESKSVLVHFHANYGMYLIEKAKFYEALTQANLSLQHWNNPANYSIYATAFRVKSEALYHLGKNRLSYLYKLRGLEASKHTHDYYVRSLAYVNTADFLFKLGKLEKSREFAEEGYSQALENQILYVQTLGLALLIKIYQQKKDLNKVVALYEQLTQAKEEMFHTEKVKSISEWQTKFDVAQKDKLAQELRTEMAEYNLKLLRTQMNPHFIFNSINSINNFVVKSKTEEASTYLLHFAQLMRQILDASKQKFISLQQELNFNQRYIELENLRLEVPFEFQIICDENLDLDDLKIPPLLLQPFIENAIWHGLAHRKTPGLLQIEIVEKNEEIILSITDNGIGRKQSALLNEGRKNHTSHGLQITRTRIIEGIKGSLEIVDLMDGDKILGTKVNISWHI